MSVLPDLPVELWEHIASFLPRGFVQTLYSINRPLFYMALNESHRVAIIDVFAYMDTQRTLQNPEIRERARRVVVCDNVKDRLCLHPACHVHVHSENVAPHANPTGETQLFLNKLHLLRKRGQWKTPAQIDRYYDQMNNAVQRMDYIRELKLKVASTLEDQYSRKLQLTKAILAVPFNHISNLDLNCPLEDLDRVLTPDLVLPRLSTLCLTVHTLDSPSRAALDMLQLFLENHRGSVEALELCLSDMNIPAHFQLPKFSVLSRLCLVCNTNRGTPLISMAMRNFLSQHSSQLRTMTLFVRSYSLRFASSAVDLGLLEFPNLTDLTLGMLPNVFVSGSELREYLQTYQRTLTSLQLFTDRCAYARFEKGFSGLELNLRRLALTTEYLCIRLLRCIAISFPALQDLVINVKHSIVIESPDELNPSSLPDGPEAIEMLRNWNLHSITLIPLSPLMKISVKDRALAVSILPRVCVFSEVSPAEYATAELDPGVALKDGEHCWGAGFDLARISSAISTDTCFL